MSRAIKISLAIFAGLAGLFTAWGVVRAAPLFLVKTGSGTPAAMITPTPLPNQPAGEAPEISFIDSPTSSCVLPRRNTGVCLMSWPYMYVDGGDNYIITMTVAIDDKAQAQYRGFFQTQMYVPSEMLTFQVPCGEPGAGGNPSLGASHSFTLRARDSSGLGAANYGSVTCPADLPARTFIPLLNRK